MVDYLTLSVILFSFVLGEIIALRFRIPPLIVFLVIGALVGTYGFVQQSDTLSFLGELGSILLLFAIGTEFSIGRLIHDGFGRAGAIAIIEIVIAMGLLYFAFLLWFSQPVAIILALAFSITSTGTTVKLIKSLELGKKFNISQMIQISIIEDLVAVFAFSVINSFAIIRSPKPEEVAVSFLVSLVLFVIAYYVFTRLLNRIIYRYRIVGEDMLMLALALLLLFVSIATYLNLSAAFGAYIAGSIVSEWKSRNGTLEEDMRKFSYTFIAFFFFTIGLSVNLFAIDYVLLLVVLPLVVAAKFVSLFGGGLAVLKNVKRPFFMAAGMLSIGELSLVIVSAAVGSSMMSESFLGLSSFVVFFSVIISYAMVINIDRIYLAISRVPGSA